MIPKETKDTCSSFVLGATKEIGAPHSTRTVEDEIQRMIAILHEIDDGFEAWIGDFSFGITKENAGRKYNWTDENEIKQVEGEEKIE